MVTPLWVISTNCLSSGCLSRSTYVDRLECNTVNRRVDRKAENSQVLRKLLGGGRSSPPERSRRRSTGELTGRRRTVKFSGSCQAKDGQVLRKQLKTVNGMLTGSGQLKVDRLSMGRKYLLVGITNMKSTKEYRRALVIANGRRRPKDLVAATTLDVVDSWQRVVGLQSRWQTCCAYVVCAVGRLPSWWTEQVAGCRAGGRLWTTLNLPIG